MGKLEVGTLSLTDLKFTSVAVDRFDSSSGIPRYYVRELIESAHLSIWTTSDRSGEPALSGTVTGTLVAQFVCEPKQREAVREIDIEGGGLVLTLKPDKPIAQTAFGTQASLEALRATIRNRGPLHLRTEGSNGQLSLSISGAELSGVSLPLTGDSAPRTWSFTGGQLESLLDLANGAIRTSSATASVNKRFTIDGRSVVKAGSLVVETAQATAKSARLAFDGRTTTLSVSGFEPAAPILRVEGESLSVAAIASVTVASITTSFPTQTSSSQPTTSVEKAVVVPDRAAIIRLVNDAGHEPDVLMPTGTEPLPFISSHALRTYYDSLSSAALDKENHHSILMVQKPSGVVTEVHHERQEGPGHYVCVTVAFAAKAAVFGVGWSEAVSSVTSLGLTSGLWAGVILTPAVTPFVFAGVTAVGAVGIVAGSEYFWSNVEEDTGIVGLPGLKGNDIKGSLAQSGIEKSCDLALEFFDDAATAKALPSKPVTLPELEKGMKPADGFRRRVSVLEKQAASLPTLSPADLARLSNTLKCCDLRPTQRAIRANESIWLNHALEGKGTIDKTFAEWQKQISAAWQAEQAANSRASNAEAAYVERLRQEDAARMRASFGTSSGGQGVTVDFGTGGGAGSSGTGGGSSVPHMPGTPYGTCNSCGCAINCLSTSIPPRR
jgi:hypothetical protein